MKNLFELVPQKRKYYIYHPFGGMNKVIADVAKVVKPDLNIVDAGGKVVLGMDALAVDVLASRFVNRAREMDWSNAKSTIHNSG